MPLSLTDTLPIFGSQLDALDARERDRDHVDPAHRAGRAHLLSQCDAQEIFLDQTV